MINITKAPNYETLKASFKDGIEFRRIPFRTYFQKTFVNTTVDNEYLKNVTLGLLTLNKNIKLKEAKGDESSLKVKFDYNGLIMKLIKTTLLPTDWGRVVKKVAVSSYAKELLEEGRYKISNTFNMGRENPDVCFMAWYDAIAEYVLDTANRLIGEKTPIPVINAELKKIEKYVLNDPNFEESKTSVFKELKRLYPKTYKKRLKFFEKSYNTKVQNGIK